MAVGDPCNPPIISLGSVPGKVLASGLMAAIEDRRQRGLHHPLSELVRRLREGEGGGGGGGGGGGPRDGGMPDAGGCPGDEEGQEPHHKARRLRTRFLEHHVWAVYGHVQLLHRLQRELTCVADDPQLRRFVTEMGQREEADLSEDGVTYGSRLALYLRGMTQAGADAGPMSRFLARVEGLGRGPGASAALRDVAVAEGAPAAAARHMAATLALATEGSAAEVAAVFAFAREDPVPHMFAAPLGDGDGDVQRYALLCLRMPAPCETGSASPAAKRVRWGATLCRTTIDINRLDPSPTLAHLTSPHLTSPHFTFPHRTPPHLTSLTAPPPPPPRQTRRCHAV